MKSADDSVVNHPSHYSHDGFECIDVMLSCFGPDDVMAFCKLNAFKYLYRSNFKGHPIQDLEKANWYLDKYMELDRKYNKIRIDGNGRIKVEIQ